jgi:hypothetical protein
MAYDSGSIKSPMGDFACPDPKSMPTGSREGVGIEGSSRGGNQINSPLPGNVPSPGSYPSEIPVITMQNIPGQPSSTPTDAIVTGQTVPGRG